MMQLQRSLGNQAGGHGLCQPKAGLRPGRAYAVRTRAARGGHDDEPIRPQGSLRSPARDLHQHLTRPGGGPIGGMHGEGFEAPYSMHHRTRMLDVDALNDSMRYTGAARLRNVQAPDQAFGMIFNLDHVVVDTRGALARAWKALAARKGLPCPENTLNLVLMDTCSERIMMDVLGWSRDLKAVKGLCWELAEEYGVQLGVAEPLLQPPQQPPTGAAGSTSQASAAQGTAAAAAEAQQGSSSAPALPVVALPVPESRAAPGLRGWLDSAASYDIPCAAVTTLGRVTARRLLERLHLHDHFRVLITAEDELETQAQSYLAAALRLQRPPNHCVVFDDCPNGITAAHNASMKAVALASPLFPAYKLRAADVTVSCLSSLAVYNLRRLFANVGSEVGDLQKQQSNDKPGNKKRITNALL